MKKTKTGCLIVWVVLSTNLFAVTGSLRPVANLFVLSPGPASPYPDANDYNFGGSGSLCVSAATARAYDPLSGIDHAPKGEFTTLLKFDPVLCTGTTLQRITLQLAITNGNQSANRLFNYLGGAGDFDLYLLDNTWQQGYGSPKTPAGPDVGLTWTTLGTLAAETGPVYLETLHYDAFYSYAEGENRFDYLLDLDHDNYLPLRNAVQSGQPITLMLQPSAWSSVCFNIRAYIQNSPDGTVSYRDEGPVLQATVRLPLSEVDFDGSGTVDLADLLQYLAADWLATGDNLPADIAPLGGDGTVNWQDGAEFARHWLRSESDR